ncbi:MAG: DUF928 domain-containing protein, partial [Cyanobacteriota bacterium]|nr:DUF928 domain-containing protein [Cyanobacteriota bacterium]
MIRRHFLILSLLTCTSLILLAQFVPVSHLLPDRAQLPARSLLAPSAHARTTAAKQSLFTLPVNSKPGRSQGSGSRGCAQGDLAEVTLLIPSKTVAGQTVSPRPTFLWKVSEPVSEPIKFTIWQPGEIEPLYETQIDADEAGIVAVQLPDNSPELNPNQLYTWTVSLICNKKR